MSNELPAPQPQPILLAGVFIDMQGQISVQSQPDVDPIVLFADAIHMIEIQRMAEASKKPKLYVARGGLPR